MAATSVLKLVIDDKEYEASLKAAKRGMLDLQQALQNAGKSFADIDREQLAYIRGIGQMNTTNKSARGSVGELTSAYTEMALVYKRMSDEIKRSDAGKALAQSLDQLKVRLNDTKKDLAAVQKELSDMNGSKFGQFGSVIDSLGQKIGLNANLTELVTSKTAMMTAGISASVYIIGKATSEWAKYNAELSKQDQITTVTTGMQGSGADRMTDQARALVDTYNVDFREAINAANTLMTQFGESGEGAMQLIRDGMRGMIQGDGPKLLSMIQQYAPSFRDAGISASQLVAIIQNSEGGIFTDENMNAIVMGIKNIRLMTNATSEALAKLGIDGQEMTRRLNDGTMTIFEAMQKVSNAIIKSGSASQAAGEVMQQVFGRQGAAAGTKLGEAIATLNTNLDETKRQTGEVGDAYDDLYEANVKLNGAIRDCFGYDGWEQMATGIKSKLVSALANVLDYLGKIKGALGGFSITQHQGDIRNGGNAFIDRAVSNLGDGKSQGKKNIYQKQLGAYANQIVKINDQITELKHKAGEDVDGNMSLNYEKQIRNLENRKAAIKKNMDEYDRRAQAVFAAANTPTNTNLTVGNGGKTVGKGSGTSAAQQAAKSIEAAEQEYARQLEKAALEVQGGTIDTVQQKQKELQATEALWTAYSKASDTVNNTNAGYKTRQEELGQRIVALGGETVKLTEAQRNAQQAARELEQKQKNLANAIEDAVKAQHGNDLNEFYKAQAKAVQNGGTAVSATGFSVTESNAAAFIQRLNEEIAKQDPGTTLYNNLTARLKDTQALQTVISKAIKNGVQMPEGFDVQNLWKTVFTEDGNIPNETWRSMLNSINEKLKEGGFEPIKLTATLDYTEDEDNIDSDNNWKKKGITKKQQDQKTDSKNGKDNEIKITEEFGKFNNGLSSIANGIQSLGIELPEDLNKAIGVLQGIMNIMQGISAIVSVIQAVSTAQAVKFWAHGGVVHAAGGWSGIVPGTQYSGDNIPAMLDAGEVVLNRAQTAALANDIQSNSQRVGTARASVSGEQIWIALNNFTKASGRGELVTW